MKKITLLLLSFCAIVVQAQNVQIPDPNFKSYLVNNSAINTNGDTEIQVSEAQAFTGTLDCNTKDIADLTGLEYFVNLDSLIFYNNQVSVLDLSPFTNLSYLHCWNNQLSNLNITTNTTLTYLYCGSNQLSSLDVSNNTALIELYCNGNQLSSLDVSNNTSLTQLYCNNNQLSSLNVSNNTALTRLWCSQNQLSNLNTSNNPLLTHIVCWGNQLSSLDLSNNVNLLALGCESNQLNSLDVSNNTALTQLYCGDNQLNSLNVSANTALTYFYCNNNQLSSLDVSNNTALIQLRCQFNQITGLDVSANTALTQLYCWSNQLSNLNVANGNNTSMLDMQAPFNTNLSCIQIDAGYSPTNGWLKDASTGWSTNCSTFTPCTQIVNIPDFRFSQALLHHSPAIDTDGDGIICLSEAQAYNLALDISFKNITNLTGLEAFTNITSLRCNGNQITSLDISANTALTTLECWSNQLNSLNTGSVALTTLDCRRNQLSSLNLTSNTALTTLTCSYNQLNSLDLSANTALTTLNCENNQLSSLDVSNNTALTQLYCNNNQLSSLNTGSVALTSLRCRNNQLSSLDISANTALTELFCNNNQLSSLNVANGNNTNLHNVNALSNPNLNCIQIDAGYTPSSGWVKDATAGWSDNCSTYTPLCTQIVNIPDVNLLIKLLNHNPTIDTDGDGAICLNEAQAFNGILNLINYYGVNGRITDITGLEAFTAMTGLNCSYNGIDSLDLSANTALTRVICNSNTNSLKYINLSTNVSLTYLECNYNNELTDLDLPASTVLDSISCQYNKLNTLDVSANTALVYLNCPNNKLSDLDLSTNTALAYLNCRYNNLSNLNLANGNNSNIANMWSIGGNANLRCIEIDAGFTPPPYNSGTQMGWSKNATANYGTNCCVIATGTDEQTACGSFTWLNGATYTSSYAAPSYTLFGAGANGCDSVVTLNLTINPIATGVDVQEECGSYTWIDGNTYTSSNNTATHTIANGAANGCDSVVTLNLTINTYVPGVDSIETCNTSYTWIDGNTYTSSNNTATHTITNGAANGCDSVVILNLTIGTPTDSTISYTGCQGDGYSIVVGSTTYDENNPTGTETLINAVNCDSVVTVNLVFNAPTTSIDVQNTCGSSYTWIDGNTYTSNNNTATHTLSSSVTGCDSVVTLNLAFTSYSSGIDVKNECTSYTWIDGNTYTSSNNTATHTIPNGSIYNCDSIVTLNLTIGMPTDSTISYIGCQGDGYSIVVGSTTYNENNSTGTETLTNAANCDSVVTINLVFNAPSSSTDVIDTCTTAFTWIDGNVYTSSNNTATYTIPNGAVNGCDSVVTLNLTIETITTPSITQSSNTLSATSISNASYQWIDCNTNSAISGATSQSFAPQNNGQYAVVAYNSSCSDTSTCFDFTSVNINNVYTNEMNIYPNPTKDVVFVELYEHNSSATIEIKNSLGQTVLNTSIEKGIHSISLKELSSGMYFMHITLENNKSFIEKLIKYK